MEVFRGLQIALDLGLSLNFKKKSLLRKAIVDNGGTISYIVTKKCHIVITSDPEKCDVSTKCRMALKHGLPVLKLDYIWDCLADGKLQPYSDYVVGGKDTSLDFKKGKISAGKVDKQSKKRKTGSHVQFNPSSVRVWAGEDSAQPEYKEKSHEVVKYAVFTGFNSTAKCEYSYVVELHAPSQVQSHQADSNRRDEDLTKTELFPYRVFFQSGSTSSIKAGKHSQCESRYTSTADQALAVYAMLVNRVTKISEVEICRAPVRGLGSTLLQRKITKVVQAHEGCSVEVQDLVEHIWREAMTEVSSLLGSVTSIKLDQVEKADAVLSKISSALQSSQSETDIQKIVKDFYNTLKHKNENLDSVLQAKLQWKLWLTKKRDLCQLVKDIVSVSEMTNYESQAVVEAKYTALRCRITAVSGAQREEIENLLLTSNSGGLKLKVLNVFEVWRQGEDVDYRYDLQPRRLLFHSSRVENFVGILSRGLLLPKVIVDDYGGRRSDAGMLGSGIYFASASSTSLQYSAPSSTKGTRLMLVNEVALGNIKDYFQHDTTLTAPPDGYDSTHGVGRDQDNSSQFEVHEYVVYNVNQQRVRYLVEFATADDIPRTIDIARQDDSYLSSDTARDKGKKDLSLHDVVGVTDPMAKVKPGLVGSGDQEVELKGVHIRAKLLDLAGEVVVLQEYYNNSSQPIEAKYVFPLGEAAAVCGFEAFINGKHVVGEVKEKETAHREYKQAISEGHGAYLMDQDEEAPDVFTVSVGNLPVGACVLIKITYVTELRVENEKINFRLPGTVAPWKEKAALVKTTQTELESHKTKAMKTSVQVAVEMPFDIRSLDCPTHKVKIKQTASKAFVELAGHQEFGSGFLLLIGLAEIHMPRMWVEQHPSKSDHQACMLTFYPEFELEELVEGEIIIIIDLSNSMKSTEILKLALLVLQNIPEGFKFNIIRFGSDYEELFPAPKLKVDDSVQVAQQFVQSSSINMGSTDICNALRPLHLLSPGDANSTPLSRNVFLLSDGHFIEEELLLEQASLYKWHTRIFTFGVSSSCNNHAMRALARVSAGAFEYFEPKVKSKWQLKVKSQVTKAMQPGLSSVSVEWRQYDDNLPQSVQAPRQITALFSGSQQIVYGYVPNCTMANLRAVIGGQEVSTVVSTSELSITKGLLVHRLTARAIIQDWETGMLARDRTQHELTKMDLKDYVIDLSKQYSIVTQLTSFVAVEKRAENEKETLPKGPSMKELLDREIVDNLPYMGWTSVPEPTLESLIEELSFEDGEKEAESLLKERTEKTALLEELYRKKTGTTKPCSLEMLQTAAVLIQSYKSLGEEDKAHNITVQALKDASSEVDQVVSTDNYTAIAILMANLRGQLLQKSSKSEVSDVFIPWPKTGSGSIKVKSLTGQICELSCTPNMSIRQLKDLIHKKEGLPQDSLRLIYNGRQLEDSSTLHDCGADFGAVFHLVKRLRGGGEFQGRGIITVKSQTGLIFEFSCTPNMSIRQLKDLIHKKRGLPQDSLRLLYNDRQLEDSSTLHDCGADFNAVFHLFESFCGGGGEFQEKDTIGSPMLMGMGARRSYMNAGPALSEDKSLKVKPMNTGDSSEDESFDDAEFEETSDESMSEPIPVPRPQAPLPPAHPKHQGLLCSLSGGKKNKEEVKNQYQKDSVRSQMIQHMGTRRSAMHERLNSSEEESSDDDEEEDMGFGLFDSSGDNDEVCEKEEDMAFEVFKSLADMPYNMASPDLLCLASESSLPPEPQAQSLTLQASPQKPTRVATNVKDKELYGMEKKKKKKSFVEQSLDGVQRADQSIEREKSLELPGSAPQPTFVTTELRGASSQSTEGIGEALSTPTFSGRALFPESLGSRGGATPHKGTFGSAMTGVAPSLPSFGSGGGPTPTSGFKSQIFGGPIPQSTAGSAMFGGAATQSTAGSVMFGGAAPQSTAGSAMFGGAAPQSTAGSAMFGGAAPQSTAGSAMFGGAAPQSTAGSAMFGGAAPQSTAGSAMFGGAAPQSTAGSAMFGGAAPQPTAGSAMFGGAAPQSTAGSVMFGGAAPQSTAGSAMFGGAAPQSTAGSAMFGGAAPQSTAGSAMFGGAAPQSTAGSAMFGGAAPLSTAGSVMFGGAAPQSTAGSAMFGGVAPQSTAGSAMFGGAAPQSTAGSAMFGGAAPQSTAGSVMFGRAAPQSTAGSVMFGGAAPQSTAGSAMFGGAAPQSTAGSVMFGGAAPQSTAGSVMFGGAAPQSTAGSAMFGGAAPQLTFGSAEGKTSMPTLGFGGAAFAPKSFKSVAVEKQALNADTSMNSVSRDGFTMPLSLAKAKPQTPQSGSPTASALSPKPLQRRSSRSVASSASLETVLGDAAIPPPLPPVRDRLARGKPPAPPSTLTGSAPPPPLSATPPPLSAPPLPLSAPPLPPPPPPPHCLSPQLPQSNSKLQRHVKALKTRIGNSSRPIEDMSIGSYLPTSPAYAPTSPAYALQSNQEQAEEGKLSKKAHRPISWRAISERSSTTTYDQIYDCMGNVYGETESLIHETYDHEAAKVERSFQHSRSRSRDMSPLMKSSDRRREIARKEGKELNPLKRPGTVYKSVYEASPEKKQWQEVTLSTFGIGTDLSPARVCHSVPFSEERVTKLLQLQSKDGSWQFGQRLDDVIGVDSDRCLAVLHTSGLSSLGMKAQEDIPRLLATTLALFMLLKKLLPEFSTSKNPDCADIVDHLRLLQRSQAQVMLNEAFGDSKGQLIAEAVIRALEFLKEMDSKYPALYSRLELGSSWFNVATYLMSPSGEVLV